MICKKCGTENNNRSVCINCGNFIGKNKTIRETDPEKIKANRRKKTMFMLKETLISILQMIGLLLVGGLIIFLVSLLFVKFMPMPTM